MTIKFLVVAVITALILPIGGWGVSHPQAAFAAYIVLPHLKIEQIQLSINFAGDFQSGWRERLYHRADEVVGAADLHFAPVSNPLQVGKARLKITIMAINLEEGSPYAEFGLLGTCQGKGAWLFDSKMDLLDWTYAPRNPDIPMLTSIWGQYRPLPIIKDQVTYEELESELVKLLNHFIVEYKLANPSPKGE